MSMPPATLADPSLDALAVIEEEARAVAQFFGVERCDAVAAMLSRRVAARLGGQEWYVAGARAKRALRDAEIRRRFTGRNLAELAEEFELDVRQVRRIVRKKAC